MEAKDIFEKHYGKIVNQVTPVVIEYGWLLEGKVAYEISTDHESRLWAVTVVSYNEATGETAEDRDKRFVSRSKTAVWKHIDDVRYEYQ